MEKREISRSGHLEKKGGFGKKKIRKMENWEKENYAQ